MDTHTEVWRHTDLAPDHVMVSNRARVRTNDRVAQASNGITQRRKGTVLSPWVSRNGYYTVSVKVGKERRKYLVHRLVASAFCEGFHPDLCINHLDGNKRNNMPDNLEWTTLAKNTIHQWETGLVNLRGENHPSSKLTAEQVTNARRLMARGVSANSLAKAMGVTCGMLCLIRKRKRWASVE